jgi:hypothetical protein
LVLASPKLLVNDSLRIKLGASLIGLSPLIGSFCVALIVVLLKAAALYVEVTLDAIEFFTKKEKKNRTKEEEEKELKAMLFGFFLIAVPSIIFGSLVLTSTPPFVVDESKRINLGASLIGLNFINFPLAKLALNISRSSKKAQLILLNFAVFFFVYSNFSSIIFGSLVLTSPSFVVDKAARLTLGAFFLWIELFCSFNSYLFCCYLSLSYVVFVYFCCH